MRYKIDSFLRDSEMPRGKPKKCFFSATKFHRIIFKELEVRLASCWVSRKKPHIEDRYLLSLLKLA